MIWLSCADKCLVGSRKKHFPKNYYTGCTFNSASGDVKTTVPCRIRVPNIFSLCLWHGRTNQQPRANRYRLTSLVVRSVPYKNTGMPARKIAEMRNAPVIKRHHNHDQAALKVDRIKPRLAGCTRFCRLIFFEKCFFQRPRGPPQRFQRKGRDRTRPSPRSMSGFAAKALQSNGINRH